MSVTQFQGDMDHLGKFLIANGDAESWNSWRAEHQSVRPNLAGLDLEGHGTLVGFDFLETDLRGANLSGADIHKPFAACAMPAISTLRVDKSMTVEGSNVRSV